MNKDLTLHLDNFSEEIQKAAIAFKVEWLKKHESNPEEYPLTLPNENAGLWYEFFINFMLTNEI
jgi:hypothetical protein